MKNIRIIYLSLFIVGLLSNCQNTKKETDLPKSTIKGYLKGILPENNDLKITISNSITGDRIIYQLPIDSTGDFSLEIPLTYSTLAGIESKYFDNSFIYLSPNKTSHLNINIDKNDQSSIQIIDDISMSAYERSYFYKKMLNILMNTSLSQGINSVLEPIVYQQYMTKQIEEILSTIDGDTILPTQGKSILKNELNLFYTQVALMRYKSYMSLIVENKELEEKEIKEPEISYYSFLKKINLSDSTLFSTTYYHILLHDILQYPVFGVQAVDETSPSLWINNVKEKLQEVVGEKQNLFYDMLLANSYSNQLNQMHPFSKKQIENIQSYYKEGNIGKILLSENHKVNILLDEDIKQNITAPDSTKSSIEKQNSDQAELFMKHIFDKYNDRIIVLDFWATWCGPCLKSIDEIKPYKKDLVKKGIVFVYVTTESSPPKTWEIMKKDIEGEHYYVNEQTWIELLSYYEFKSIPNILVFDKNNKMHKRIDGYIKNDKRLVNSLNKLF